MIKQIAAFLLLLISGLLVLNLAIGSDRLFPSSNTTPRLDDGPDPKGSGSGLHVGKADGGGVSRSMRMRVSGSIEFISERRIILPDGSSRPLRRYWLRAEDSRLHPDETQELEEVRVVFYDVGGPADQPTPKPSGLLEAKRAWIEIAEDETGRRRIAEDKEIDLRNVLLTTGSDAEVPDLRLSVAELLVLSTAQAVHLHTRNPAEPFDLDLGGSRPLHLKGRGLEALLPSKGQQKSPSVETDILINSDPVLTAISPSRTTRLSASGSGRYRENLTSGMTLIRLEDKVRIEGLRLGIREASGGRAEGDSLQATLHREGENETSTDPDSQTRLHKIHLAGTPDIPARLITPDLNLSCQQLDSLPSNDGEIYLFSASGNPELLTQGDRPTAFTSDAKIHLVFLRNHLSPILGSFGFPEWSLGPLLDQLAIFEGRSSLQEEGVRVKASEGLEVLRNSNIPGFLTMNGHGAVEINEGEGGLAVRGNRGFFLHATPDRETAFLGPRVMNSEHHFQVQHADLLLSGTGTCLLVRDKDTTNEIHLRSPASDIDVQLSSGRGQLTQASRLDARMGSGGLSALEAAGDPCHLITTTAEGRVETTALVMQSQEPNVWLFSGSPARVVSESQGILTGKEIQVFQLDGQNALFLATGNARIEFSDQPAKKSEPTTRKSTLDAASIEIIPFVAPPESIAPYARFLPSFAQHLHQRPHTSGYLFARGSVELQDHAVGSNKEILASGKILIMSVDDGSGCITGYPARFQRTGDQQALSGVASSIRFPATSSGGSLMLLPEGPLTPRLTIQGSSGSLARLSGRGGTTTIESRGPIQANSKAFQMADLVKIKSLLPDGSIHPEGAQLRANKVIIRRDPQTGEALRVFAQGNTNLRWKGLRADSQELSLNLQSNLCVARGGEREAVITLPDQTSCRGPWVEVNYLTYEVRAWKTLFTEGRGK